MPTRKERIRAYKETPIEMGVYRVHNTLENKSFVGASSNVNARLSRHLAELRWGTNRHATLQADWKTHGPDAFLFEVMDVLPASDDADYEPGDDLKELETLWREKLKESGVELY